MFRSRYVCGPLGQEDTGGHSIPPIPELEASLSALVGGCDLGMEGLRRPLLAATDSLEDPHSADLHYSAALGHDPSLHYETESLQLSDTADLCRMSQYKLQSTSDPILHGDRHLGDDPTDVMYTELTNHYREFSPGGSTGDCGFEPESSDSSGSDSGLESPTSAVHWESIAECSAISFAIDHDGPLPPVSDIFNHRLHKDDYADLYCHRPNIPLFIKAERIDPPTNSEGDDNSLDSSFPPSLPSLPSLSSSSPTHHHPHPHHHHHQQQHHLSYTTLQPHQPMLLSNVVTPTPSISATTTTATTTTNNSNYHDYTTTAATPTEGKEKEKEQRREGERMDWMEERSLKSGHHHRGGQESGDRSEGEKGNGGQRKKPGRKKGQVSKVLHLWEFIRDLLGDPAHCPSIISWENETEGVFRVLQSSEVARLWGEKKKNKKIMTYEKLSRSLRYSRKEGYFDALPRDRGYPKKLCFKFGPKSHGWREFSLKGSQPQHHQQQQQHGMCG